MANSKFTLFISTLLLGISIHGFSQQFTGFKNTDNQKKLEANFDSKLSAKRVGENIKLMSSVPHHIGSVGGKFVAEEIAKKFRRNSIWVC